jgi:ABC-type antimicrobial peptide transport system permease subunit
LQKNVSAGFRFTIVQKFYNILNVTNVKQKRARMEKLRVLPRTIIIIGIIFAIAGLVAAGGGVYIRAFVGQQLADQNITTPGDASIPNTQVNSIPTALSMADIIQEHAARITNGLTYAEMGRFAVPDGDPAGTSNPDEALLDESGNPVPNTARDTQLTAASLVTSLSLSAMAFGLSYGVIVLGLAFVLLGLVIAGLGYALLGLVTPEVAERFGFKPVSKK